MTDMMREYDGPFEFVVPCSMLFAFCFSGSPLLVSGEISAFVF